MASATELDKTSATCLPKPRKSDSRAGGTCTRLGKVQPRALRALLELQRLRRGDERLPRRVTVESRDRNPERTFWDFQRIEPKPRINEHIGARSNSPTRRRLDAER